MARLLVAAAAVGDAADLSPMADLRHSPRLSRSSRCTAMCLLLRLLMRVEGAADVADAVEEVLVAVLVVERPPLPPLRTSSLEGCE